jgi:hypothetical protein
MKILSRLPIPLAETLDFVGAESVRFKEAEIIVWVSLADIRTGAWNPNAPRFPAILDTGHTHNFAIHEHHLTRWAGIRRENLRLLGHIRQAGRRVPLHAAKLWLHHNEPGKLTVASRRLLLNLPRGIAVYREGENYPRLPLLGLRALLSNHLHLAIDGQRTSVNLRTPDWKTWLLRWLG